MKGGLNFKRTGRWGEEGRGGESGNKSDMFAVRIWRVETAHVWAAERSRAERGLAVRWMVKKTDGKTKRKLGTDRNRQTDGIADRP